MTVTESELAGLLPVEIAWWMVVKWRWQPGNWILVLTRTAQLVAGLAVRAAAGTNVVWGVTQAHLAVNELAPFTDEMNRLLRVFDGLPPIRWNQDRPDVRR